MIRLSQLIHNIPHTLCGITDAVVHKIEFDSRKIGEGDLFVCLDGHAEDGHFYARQAISAGACAVVCTKPLGEDVPQVLVEDTRRALSLLAANYFGNPVKDMKFIAVTGTNGKTSTAFLIHEILKSCGKKTGFIGTIYYEIAGERYASDMTTPDPFMLNRLFYEMREAGVEFVVAEVSAHAIFLNKLYGIQSDIAVFTNFSQDHLDFFKDLDEYRRVKMSYFSPENTKLGIVNADDDCGRQILQGADIPLVSYGLDNPSDTFALHVKTGAFGTRFVLNVMDRLVQIETPLIGRFNVYNIMAAASACAALGVRAGHIAEALSTMPPPEGRFNVIFHAGVHYIIDYAHTPDGLDNLLREAKRMGSGRLIVLFGCGGDRDRLKRPMMGSIADRYADILLLTEDNSRTEQTLDIIEDIKSGVFAKNKIEVHEERADAVRRAVELAECSDVVVLAGKGAEDYLDKGGKKVYFSDRDALERCLGRG